MKKPVCLIIMDGYGLSEEKEGNAILQANTKNIDSLTAKYPNTTLKCSGLEVGLPEGQMGNSEVGHLNLGAGRVVFQSLTRINITSEKDAFNEIDVVADALRYAKENNRRVHVLGLLSDGGVHSHINHMKALLKTIKDASLEGYLHGFLDGRDVSPKSAIKYVEEIQKENYNIGSLSGRFFAMDRDKNFDRVQKFIDVAFTKSEVKEPISHINKMYTEGITDEFIEPFLCNEESIIEEGDVVISANFRPDRAIQYSTFITNPEAIGQKQDKKVRFISVTNYSDDVVGDIVFPHNEIVNTLGEVLEKNNLKQLRIAETEKYAHVTFFFDGGLDKEIEGSQRVLVNSPKDVATYDLKPEMSAYEVCDKLIAELDKEIHDVIILNFANCDMVGHTANIEAVIKSVETTDELVGRVYNKVKEKGGVCLITADHGNAEQLCDENGNPHTAHTANDVPFIVTDTNVSLKPGKLGNVAPTILDFLDIKKPKEMTEDSLITRK